MTSGARPGVNVVGYLRSETGVGEAARAIVRGLRAEGHHVACTAVHSPDGARQGDASAGALTNAAPHDLSIVCVNANQVDVVRRELGPAFFTGRYNIGVWFWELDTFPAGEPALAVFDELWAASTFVQRALADVAPVPVVHVGLPVTPPAACAPAHARLGLAADRPVVLFVFDALSVVARKNPLAVVEAYQRAFADDLGRAQLVIKASRLELFPDDHRALAAAVAAVGGRLIDHYLTRAELGALFHAATIYISLHRSEGFGLTMAEAMACGTAVVATAYSGNLDFMTCDNSALVPWTPASVPPGAGPYPAGATWAEPDVADAARLLRRLVTEPGYAARLGARAARDLARTHSADAIGRRMSARLQAIADRRAGTPAHRRIA